MEFFLADFFDSFVVDLVRFDLFNESIVNTLNYPSWIVLNGNMFTRSDR